MLQRQTLCGLANHWLHPSHGTGVSDGLDGGSRVIKSECEGKLGRITFVPICLHGRDTQFGMNFNISQLGEDWFAYITTFAWAIKDRPTPALKEELTTLKLRPALPQRPKTAPTTAPKTPGATP